MNNPYLRSPYSFPPGQHPKQSHFPPRQYSPLRPDLQSPWNSPGSGPSRQHSQQSYFPPRQSSPVRPNVRSPWNSPGDGNSPMSFDGRNESLRFGSPPSIYHTPNSTFSDSRSWSDQFSSSPFNSPRGNRGKYSNRRQSFSNPYTRPQSSGGGRSRGMGYQQPFSPQFNSSFSGRNSYSGNKSSFYKFSMVRDPWTSCIPVKVTSQTRPPKICIL